MMGLIAAEDIFRLVALRTMLWTALCTPVWIATEYSVVVTAASIIDVVKVIQSGAR